ncbi:MAG: diguanylate cyclase domain-containing protein [Gammaproteobacteria bacterium]|jgi:diguanylate cyclase (GGDEF)-like protein
MDLTETAAFRIGVKQVDRLFNAARLDCAVSLIGASLLIAAVWVGNGSNTLFALCGAAAIVSIARLLIARAYNSKPRPSSAVKRWQLTFNVGTLVAGALWGAIAATLLVNDQLSAASVALGVAASESLAGVVLFAGSYVITVLFAAAALVPPAVAAGIRVDANGALFAAGAIAAFVVTALCGRVVKQVMWEAVMAQTECEQLTGHLDQRRTQVEKLNVALKTNADKREQAEITLRRTAADLGLVQGKAKALADTLERVSPMCQVTGLANRRHFDVELDSEWRRAMREQKPMSLVIVEIDEFEDYATKYGNQSADALLKRVAQTMKGFGRRSGDLAGRYEDEKLALMLSGCDIQNAARMADALRKRIEGTKIAHAGSKNSDTVTVHVGVATMKPSRGLQKEELSKRADAALYEARFQGGNKIVTYKPLSKLKLERWSKPSDGPLSEQSLTQKLLVWGYDTTKDIFTPDAKPREHVSEYDTVIAILTGELLIDVEGHTMTINPGDSIFVPSGVVLRLQATGEHPVISFTATKSA